MQAATQGPRTPLGACALQRTICRFFHRPSKAKQLQQQLAPLAAESLQAAVLRPPSHFAASNATLRCGAVVTAVAVGLTGTWKKNKAISDSMDRACEAVQLSWVLRKALGVLKTLEIEETPEMFTTRIKAGGVMDVVEHYPFSGQVVLHKRRDKRRGEHRGFVKRTPDGPCIHVEWDNPFGGVCEDTFQLSEDNMQLTQVTEMNMADTGEHILYKTVYRRA